VPPTFVAGPRRAGIFDYFVDEFENVVAEETYTQDSSQMLGEFLAPQRQRRGGAAQAAVAVGHAAGAASRPDVPTTCS